MKVLLDTHIVLWFITGETERIEQVLPLILEKENDIYFSLASVWEIAIKHKKHPELMPISEEEFYEACIEARLDLLEINNQHIFQIKSLLRKEGTEQHNDPFDRLLLAQADSEDMVFVSHDARLREYKSKVFIV